MSFGLVKHNNNSISAITTPGSLAQGKMTLIKEQTASSSASISFVDGSGGVVFDNTYPIYVFKFINIHPATNDSAFTFNGSTDTGSNYNVTKTSTAFNAYHRENGSEASFAYQAGHDMAQGTGFQRTLYHFIQQVFDNQSKQESSRDLYYEFVDNIILICGYLDENYLNKYPKNKGTIKSVKDMAEWYWIGD